MKVAKTWAKLNDKSLKWQITAMIGLSSLFGEAFANNDSNMSKVTNYQRTDIHNYSDDKKRGELESAFLTNTSSIIATIATVIGLLFVFFGVSNLRKSQDPQVRKKAFVQIIVGVLLSTLTLLYMVFYVVLEGTLNSKS